jgi:hypothetical protein
LMVDQKVRAEIAKALIDKEHHKYKRHFESLRSSIESLVVGERQRWQVFRHGGRKRGTTETRDIEMADIFEQRRPSSRMSDSALMADIGKKYDLRPRAAQNAIKRGQKKLRT